MADSLIKVYKARNPCPSALSTAAPKSELPHRWPTVEVHLANGLLSMSIVGLPEITFKESKERVEAAAIASFSERGVATTPWETHPFRVPHHTASAVAVAGSGSQPRPGENSVAHQGGLVSRRAAQL